MKQIQITDIVREASKAACVVVKQSGSGEIRQTMWRGYNQAPTDNKWLHGIAGLMRHWLNDEFVIKGYQHDNGYLHVYYGEGPQLSKYESGSLVERLETLTEEYCHELGRLLGHVSHIDDRHLSLTRIKNRVEVSLKVAEKTKRVIKERLEFEAND